MMKMLKCSILGFMALILFCGSVGAQSVLIVNNSVSQASITKEDVMRVFLGKKKKWDRRDRIRVCALKRGAVHEAFLKEYVSRTPSKYTSFWKIAIVSGTASPPKFFDSEEDLITYIRKTAGAIGYISSDTPHKGVKALSVE